MVSAPILAKPSSSWIEKSSKMSGWNLSFVSSFTFDDGQRDHNVGGAFLKAEDATPLIGIRRWS
jgi:hypothetical protein